MSGTEDNRPLFRDINADDADPEVTEIESLCVNCEEQVTLFRHGSVFSSDGNGSFRSYSRSDPGSFRSYSLSVRSFRPNFRGGSFRPNFGGSFRPTLFYILPTSVFGVLVNSLVREICLFLS